VLAGPGPRGIGPPRHLDERARIGAHLGALGDSLDAPRLVQRDPARDRRMAALRAHQLAPFGEPALDGARRERLRARQLREDEQAHPIASRQPARILALLVLANAV